MAEIGGRVEPRPILAPLSWAKQKSAGFSLSPRTAFERTKTPQLITAQITKEVVSDCCEFRTQSNQQRPKTPKFMLLSTFCFNCRSSLAYCVSHFFLARFSLYFSIVSTGTFHRFNHYKTFNSFYSRTFRSN